MGKALIVQDVNFTENGIEWGQLMDKTIYADEMSWTSGKFIRYNDGTEGNLSTFSYSNAIRVAEGYANLVISHCWTSGGAFYDSSMNYVGGIHTNSDTLTPTTHAIPSGARFVRVNVKDSYKSSFYIQLKTE